MLARPFKPDWSEAQQRIPLAIISGLVSLWLLMTLVSAAATQNILFDGAMNLEVSLSLANGDGPKRLYGFDDYFPHGVQTKEPYVLLGAAVFKLFGAGPFQSQLPSLIYLVALCALVFFAVRRFSGSTAAWMATVVLLSMPMLHQYGLNGYGEIPTLFFGLAGIAAVAWPGRIEQRISQRALLAGLLCGLAVATKVVGVSLACATALTLAIRVLVESPDSRIKNLLLAAAIFFIGMSIPLLLVELWRLATLGGSGFLQWWNIELEGILYQAGVGEQTAKIPVLDKVMNHFSLLRSETRRTALATSLVLLLPIPIACGLIFQDIRRGSRSGLRWWLLALTMVSVFYLVWWMAITPTEKAWLRRIYIGLTCLSIISSISLAKLMSIALTQHRPITRVASAGLCLVLLFAYLPFVARALKSPVSFQRSEELSRTLEVADLIKRLQQEDLVFASGWYAAPTLAIYSGREFIDLTDWPLGLQGTRRAFLVADTATFVTGAADETLRRYPHRMLSVENQTAQLYELDLNKPNDPFQGKEFSTLPYVVFNDTEYAATEGMQPVDRGMGGRWISSDSEILLRYAGSEHLQMAAYMPLQSYMLTREPMKGVVLLEGCEAIPFAFEQSGWKQFAFPLEHCHLAIGSDVRVRFMLNNTANLPLVYDHQRAMLLGAIGFK